MGIIIIPDKFISLKRREINVAQHKTTIKTQATEA